MARDPDAALTHERAVNRMLIEQAIAREGILREDAAAWNDRYVELLVAAEEAAYLRLPDCPSGNRVGLVRDTAEAPLPPESAWELLADYSNVIQAADNSASARLVSGSPGIVGASYEASIEVLGIRDHFEAHLKYAERPKTLLYESGSGGAKCSLLFDIRESQGGSLVNVTLRYSAGQAGKTLEPIVTAILRPLLHKALKNLCAS